MEFLGIFSRVVDMGNSVMNYFQTRKTVNPREWLNEVDELLQFFNSHEKQILEDVFKEANRQVKSRGLPTCGSEDEIFLKIAVVKENLQVIIQNFKMCKKAKHQFVRKYPRWKEARSKSIDSLQIIGNSIHHDRHNSNISRLVGNCTSFVGGGLLVASAVLIPFTFGLTAPLAVAGGVTTALGSATSIGTSVTETILLKNKVEEAKAIVKKDKLSFEALKDWLIRANSVSEALDTILSMDVDNTIRNNLETIKQFASVVVQMSNSAHKNTLIKEFVNFALNNISPQFLLTNIFPPLIGLLVILAIQYNINQTVFNHARKTWEIVINNILPIANMSLQLLQPTITGSFLGNSTNTQRAVGTAVTRGLIAGIGMSLDVASIVLTSIDVHNGSISEEGQKIIKAANKMKEEADVLEKSSIKEWNPFFLYKWNSFSGLRAVIGMSLDVASIVLTSIDVHNGSISEEGQKFIETANKMKEKADVLENVYTKHT